MYQGTPQSPNRLAKGTSERKNVSAPNIGPPYRYVLLAQAGGPHTPAWRAAPILLTSWKYLYCGPKDFLSCAAVTMGAASSSEVVAEKLREMGEGDAQRP